ncbi:DUF1735 domain-containing protein [Plebeiibacterium sediminum]|uniref:DUF1735 domain-containing protein n=1 Tax=Plebeiibacterium sediminum TaxID=2992112 RepID=A0AAE3M9A2_9BACT|nr:DUF1735 domain-containing protein [Plebeiobacterium sediminum]MCW3788965.1 DUF1735 domain-containing protein [Plebeiobacterium sediminum]
MKSKIYYLLFAISLLSACNSDLMNPIPLIEINPGFKSPGYQQVELVSLNNSENYSINYKRVYGISRELTMSLAEDPTVLNDYNTTNGTDYKLLTSDYYSAPSSVTFDVKSNSVDFDVEIESNKIFDMAGSIEEASKYVIPLKATTNETKGVDVVEEDNYILLHVNMLSSTVTVADQTPVSLAFTKDSEIKETYSIEGVLNFNNIDPTTISLIVDETDPLAASDDYTLLPAENYTVNATQYNADENTVSIDGEINALGLSETQTYILPCRLQSSNPDCIIQQNEAIYYVINISDLKISITDASETEVFRIASGINTYNGSLNVTTNTIVSSDLSVNFSYDPTLIAAFNSANSKSYQTLPEGAISITNSKMASGTKSADIPYSIDLSGVAIDNNVQYLIPFVLNDADFEMGNMEGTNTIYIAITKSLEGVYNVNIIDQGRGRNVVNEIMPASKCQRAGDPAWDAVIANAQYVFGADGGYYSVLFSVTEEDMPGKENCKKIEIYTFLELLDFNGGTNAVSDNNSYFNTVTGEIYIDCNVYESWFNQTYKETYSFSLN